MNDHLIIRLPPLIQVGTLSVTCVYATVDHLTAKILEQSGQVNWPSFYPVTGREKRNAKKQSLIIVSEEVHGIKLYKVKQIHQLFLNFQIES